MKKQIFTLMFGVLLFSISPGKACLEPEDEPKDVTHGSFQGHYTKKGSIDKPLVEFVRSVPRPGVFLYVESWQFSFASKQKNSILLGSTSAFNIKKGQIIAIHYDLHVTQGKVFIALIDSNNTFLNALSKDYSNGEKTFGVHHQRKVASNKEGVKLAVMARGNVTDGECVIKFLYHLHDGPKEELKKK